MTALLIVLGILLLAAVLVFLPITAYVSYNNGFSVKITVLGIAVFNSKSNKKKKTTKNSGKKSKQNAEKDNKKSGKLKALIKERGFGDVFADGITLLKKVISELKNLIKRISFKDVRLNLYVAAESAALTAIEYGTVCAVFYPFLNLLNEVTNFYPESINVYSDFDKKEPSLDLYTKISASAAVLFIAAIKVYNAYKTFTEGEKE